MTTREIYFKNVIKTDMPAGMVGYTFIDKNNIIQIGKTLLLELRTDEKTVLCSIKKMNQVELTDGFMFWNSSEEGESWFKKNWFTISRTLSN